MGLNKEVLYQQVSSEVTKMMFYILFFYLFAGTASQRDPLGLHINEASTRNFVFRKCFESSLLDVVRLLHGVPRHQQPGLLFGVLVVRGKVQALLGGLQVLVKCQLHGFLQLPEDAEQ